MEFDLKVLHDIYDALDDKGRARISACYYDLTGGFGELKAVVLRDLLVEYGYLIIPPPPPTEAGALEYEDAMTAQELLMS